MSAAQSQNTHYDSYSEARKHLKDVLDTAADGRIVSVSRAGENVSVVRSGDLRDLLRSRVAVAVQPQSVFEDGAWTTFLPGLPIAAEATDFDAAVDDLIDAIREYVDDWFVRLRHATNHADNWAFTQFVSLSSDEQLREWITGIDDA